MNLSTSKKRRNRESHRTSRRRNPDDLILQEVMNDLLHAQVVLWKSKSISASSKTAASALNALLGKRLAPPTTAPENLNLRRRRRKSVLL
jgi:hypothetical protein